MLSSPRHIGGYVCRGIKDCACSGEALSLFSVFNAFCAVAFSLIAIPIQKHFVCTKPKKAERSEWLVMAQKINNIKVYSTTNWLLVVGK